MRGNSGTRSWICSRGGDISGAIKASLQDLEQFGDKYKSGANQAVKKLFPVAVGFVISGTFNPHALLGGCQSLPTTLI